MTEDEHRYIKQLLAEAEEANRFFSHAGRAERERLSCAIFLRALAVPFSVEELRLGAGWAGSS